jgi:putative membrane protein
MWYSDHMGGWGYAFMGLSNLLFWTALVVGAVALFRYLNRASGTSAVAPPRSDPEHLLAERYARGEIDDEEYHRRLDTLRASAGPAATPDRGAGPAATPDRGAGPAATP